MADFIENFLGGLAAILIAAVVVCAFILTFPWSVVILIFLLLLGG